MSTELERRVVALQKIIQGAAKPCPDHFPPFIYAEPGEGDERITALLESMRDCPRCGPARFGYPPAIVLTYPRGMNPPDVGRF